MRTMLSAMLLIATLSACDRGTAIEEQTFTVACGMCILKAEARACYWAAETEDGKVLPVIGPGVPADHEAHAPEGMCSMRRTAVIDGTLHETRIIADRFQLQPATGSPGPVHAHKH